MTYLSIPEHTNQKNTSAWVAHEFTELRRRKRQTRTRSSVNILHPRVGPISPWRAQAEALLPNATGSRVLAPTVGRKPPFRPHGPVELEIDPPSSTFRPKLNRLRLEPLKEGIPRARSPMVAAIVILPPMGRRVSSPRALNIKNNRYNTSSPTHVVTTGGKRTDQHGLPAWAISSPSVHQPPPTAPDRIRWGDACWRTTFVHSSSKKTVQKRPKIVAPWST